MIDTEVRILLGQVKAENLETRKATKELQAKTDVLIGIMSDLRDAIIRNTGEMHNLVNEMRLMRNQMSHDTVPNVKAI